MSKSLGNFITIEDGVKKYGSDELKLFFLSSHYASPIDFSEAKIEEMHKQKRNFYEYFDKVNTWKLTKGDHPAETTSKDHAKIDACKEKFDDVMDDDFNTPEAMAAMFALVDLGSKYISSDKEEGFRKVYDTLIQIFELFSINVKDKITVSNELDTLVTKRETARKDKDFQLADQIRDEILSRSGLNIVDTATGVAFIEE